MLSSIGIESDEDQEISKELPTITTLLPSSIFLGGGDEFSNSENMNAGYGAIEDKLSDPSGKKRRSHSRDKATRDDINGNGSNIDENVTYIGLLRTNKNFRYFWLSYVVTRMGNWMTYLASISLIQEVTKDHKTDTNTLISVLILVKLLPNVVFMPVGGILADSYDRRKVQIVLDVTSSGMLGVFLLSYKLRSIPICYAANFLLEVISGLYIPSNNAIVPQLVKDQEEELKKATTLTGLAWSLMAALGSSLGGILVAAFGIGGCFVIDSFTFLTSAAFLYFGVQGQYNVRASASDGVPTRDPLASKTEKRRRSSSSAYSFDGSNTIIGPGGATASESLILLMEERIEESEIPFELGTNGEANGGSLSMFLRGLKYSFVEEPIVGAYALLKGSGALAYGAADVLNVSFSARGSESNPSLTSMKLGLLFGSIGIGCIIASCITDLCSSLTYPKRIAALCLVGYCFMVIGFLIMALFPDIFYCICLSGVVRSIGSGLIWVNSTLLIQKFTPVGLLGRVNSIDTCVALFGEAASALGGGLMMDHMGVSPEKLSLILAGVALWCFVIWSPLPFKTPNGMMPAG